MGSLHPGEGYMVPFRLWGNIYLWAQTRLLAMMEEEKQQ